MKKGEGDDGHIATTSICVETAGAKLDDGISTRKAFALALRPVLCQLLGRSRPPPVAQLAVQLGHERAFCRLDGEFSG